MLPSKSMPGVGEQAATGTWWSEVGCGARESFEPEMAFARPPKERRVNACVLSENRRMRPPHGWHKAPAPSVSSFALDDSRLRLSRQWGKRLPASSVRRLDRLCC